MNEIKVKIGKKDKKKDLTIIYKETGKGLHEIKTTKESILNSLGYFTKQLNEINYQNMIFIEEDIPYELFNNFISSIETSEITLNENNYQQYFYLSSKYEFTDLQQSITEFSETRPDIKNIINEFNLNDDETKTETNKLKEDLIAKNIDFSIKCGLLQKVPIQNLIRILNSPKREIKDHHLLFSFVISIIKNKITETKNENKNNEDLDDFLILPSCLDLSLMSDEEIEELFEVEKEMLIDEEKEFLTPRNSILGIQQILKRESEIKQKYSSLETKYDQLSNEIIQFKNMMTENEKKSKQLIDDLQQRLLKLENENKEMKEEIFKEQEQKFLEINKNQNLNKIKEDELENEIKTLKLNQISNDKKIKELETIICELKSLPDKVSQIKEEKKSSISPVVDSKTNDIVCSNGIFDYLFKIKNSNPAKNGLIEITGNSYDSSYEDILPYIIDSNWKGDYWASKIVSNSYVSIDFKNYLVKISKYRLGVGTRGGLYFFRSWNVIGITEDGKEIVLDEVHDLKEIASANHEITKSIQYQQFVRSIKITMIGKCDSNREIMELYNIELFGTIRNLNI